MIDGGLGLFALRHGGNSVQVLLGQPRPGLDSSPAFWSAYAPGGDNSTTKRRVCGKRWLLRPPVAFLLQQLKTNPNTVDIASKRFDLGG